MALEVATVLNGSILAATQTWTWEDPSPSIAGIDDRVTETAYLRIRDIDTNRQAKRLLDIPGWRLRHASYITLSPMRVS